MTIALKSIIKCEIFSLDENFQGVCFGHGFSKTCQYATTKEKVCKNFKFVSIKYAHLDLQKCIIWPETFGNGRQEWNKACSNFNLLPRKLNISMKTR